MNPSDIGKAYDQITHIWQRDEFNMNNGIDAHKRALKFVSHKGQALEIGCGCTCRFIDLLSEEGFQVSGLDVSSEMLKLAKEKRPDIDFIQADICEHTLDSQYDFITAWDSIWHIPLAKQRPVITKIVDSLNSGGIFIFSFGGTDSEGDHKDDFMGPEVYYSSLGTQGFLSLFIELGCKIRHLEFDQHPELHTYLIVEKA
ncbi:class I SAM-dependent methyltransferase [Vibrio sp. RE86]|uniref:class I SAM-dependent methyltransferase n=1 Tax=Vibrio sp. RE86 TaxID=2607605 RepID=UPI001493C7E4|nr:class I SAM-dependent methyltransferase [Vibrio sp. RE86]NOH78639.1 class I SAM-dependent methyltransferase [Vibrio sp. RE86]